MSDQVNEPTLEQLKQQLAEAQELLNQQAETIKAQEAVQAALEASPGIIQTVKIGKDTYQITVPKFQYKRDGDGEESRVYTAEDLKKDAELQKELLAKKVGFLLPIVPPANAK
ncbi:hypothetical protein [Fibrivirga algicola]|uniref:Uncharacterized protein n=1 Tax=Fibrivirga algicola TaxID=2950420 RepID=A0ABX0QMP4_9BACT|nr:hypothetical protein [Fibrivirga algicola]NID13765.1 hypothetical protein [Fibrivirga algicola]